MFHTKSEIAREIEILDRLYYRADYYGQTADANRYEMKRDDLQEVHDSMKDYQLADVELEYV